MGIDVGRFPDSCISSLALLYRFRCVRRAFSPQRLRVSGLPFLYYKPFFELGGPIGARTQISRFRGDRIHHSCSRTKYQQVSFCLLYHLAIYAKRVELDSNQQLNKVHFAEPNLKLVLLERIELSSHPYQGRVIPVYYSSVIGAQGGTRTHNIQILRLTRLPIASPGRYSYS